MSSVNIKKDPFDVNISDSDGNPIGSFAGAIDIHNKDVHEVMINRHFVRFTGTTTTLVSKADSGDTALSVTSDASFSVGDWVSLVCGNTSETDFVQVNAKPGGNVLTLDRPIDNNYTLADTVVEIVTPSIQDGNGTLASPQIWKVQPPANEVWHIMRLLVNATDNTQPADSFFISAAPLANGLVFRVNGSVNKTLTVWKANTDMVSDAYDTEYNDRGGGGSDYGVRVRWTFKRSDAIVRLDGSLGESLEILVQDNIAGLSLTEIHMKAQGHLEAE